MFFRYSPILLYIIRKNVYVREYDASSKNVYSKLRCTIGKLLEGLKIFPRIFPTYLSLSFSNLLRNYGGSFYRQFARNFSRSAFMDPSIRKLQRYPIMGQGKGRTAQPMFFFLEGLLFLILARCITRVRERNTMMRSSDVLECETLEYREASGNVSSADSVYAIFHSEESRDFLESDSSNSTNNHACLAGQFYRQFCGLSTFLIISARIVIRFDWRDVDASLLPREPLKKIVFLK